MNLIVTGASGIIGKAFVELYSSEHSITALTRKIEPNFDNRIQWVETDYTVASLSKAFFGIDAVIHMAGIRFSPPFEESFTHYIDNITVSDNIFRACASMGIKKIVCASSRGVYSVSNEIPWKESDTAAPENFYGVSKLMMETMASLYSKKFNINIKCLRIAQILSADERKGYLLRTLFDLAKIKGTPTISGTGGEGREYIYVKDAARSFLYAVLYGEHSGVYNIGTGYVISIKDLAKLINRVFDNPLLIRYSDRPENLSKSLMDCSKAERELNFKAAFSIERAIKDIFDDWKRSISKDFDG